jgi:spermidine synthase
VSLPSKLAWRGYVAIGAVAAATLIYQIAITRILSVVLWYHFAFLSVSLAMLGLGAPGVWFALRPPGRRAPVWAMRAAALAVPLSIVVIFRYGDHLERGKGTVSSVASMFPPGVVLIVLAILAATMALGSAVCLLLLAAPGRQLGKMYGADLLGATLGALLVVPLLWLVPTPLLIAGCGALPLAAAQLIGGGAGELTADAAAERRRGTWLHAAMGAALVAAIAWGGPFTLRYAKDYREDASRVLYERWTPTAKLTIWNQPFQGQAAWGWGFGKRYQPGGLRQYWLEQDGSAGTPITELIGDPKALPHLFYDVTSVGYLLRPVARVCVIGAGGGRDVLTALAAGATDIDAVELNAGIIDAVSERFGEFSGHVYQRPGVHAFASEGRAHLTRTAKRFDLLQISLIDSWAATAAGAFALSENHLYTLEAFRLYLHRLSPTGILSVSRWHGGRRYLEAVRLALLARAALVAEGIADPEQHMIILQGGWVATLLVSPQPFTAADRARAAQLAEERGFSFEWPATAAASPVARALLEGPGFLSSRGFDLSPPTDDQPFFFQTVPLFGELPGGVASGLSPNEHSVFLLRRLLLIIAAITAALFFPPFALAPRRRRQLGFWRGSGYFAAIGFAFLLVEAGWIQRFILFLGHPSYATTVVIAALLAGAGAGSVAAARAPLQRVIRWAPAVGAAVLLSNAALSPILTAALGMSLVPRVALAVALLTPVGALMGFGFATGVARFGDEHKAWFWAVNGAAGVLASVGSLALAMSIGFSGVVWVGAGCYLAAAWLLRGQAPA